MTEYERIGQLLIKNLGNCKETELDKSYMYCSAGSFTRREIIKEIELQTEFGKKQIDNIIELAIDLMKRNKK